jgi:hypothetical protein
VRSCHLEHYDLPDAAVRRAAANVLVSFCERSICTPQTDYMRSTLSEPSRRFRVSRYTPRNDVLVSGLGDRMAASARGLGGDGPS